MWWTGVVAVSKQIPWRLIAIVAFALMVFLALDLSARLAAAKERAAQAERAAALQASALQIVSEEGQAFRAHTRALDRSLAQARQALEDVPHDAAAIDFLTVWARNDRSLRDSAGADLR